MFGTNQPGDKLRRARTSLMRNDKAIMERSHLLAMNRIENHPDFPTAATNGRDLFVNVPWIEKMEPEGIQFVLLHEARHRMLKHPVRFPEMIERAKMLHPDISRDSLWQIMNIAADIRINRDLIDDGWTPPKEDNGTFDHKGTYRGWSVWRIFMDLMKGAKPQPNPGWGECDPLPGDGDKKDGKPTATREQQRDFEQQVSEQNETGMLIAKKRGTVPGSMKSLIEESRAKPDWDKQLPAALSRIRGGDDFSMARMSNAGRRQRMVLPGIIGTVLEHAVIVFDTSGSVDDAEAALYLAKMNAIIRAEDPLRLTLIQCDTKVHEVMDLEQGMTLPRLEIKGRGGTAFQPAFDYIQQQGWTPDCVVYCTDGAGDNPRTPPDYHVIWLTTDRDPARWGTIIRI